MITVDSLISTSASDCKITLEGLVARRPALAGQYALELLEQLQGKEGQASRRKVAASILRKASKALLEEPS